MGRAEGLKNGRLLRQAAKHGYNVLITLDRGIAHQQNLTAHGTSLVVVKVQAKRLEHLLPDAAAILSVLADLQPGEVVFVS